MSADPLSQLVRELAALSACVEFDWATDPTRCLPHIPPDLLARYWPRIIRHLLAFDVDAGLLSEDQRLFLGTQAEMIGGRRAARDR